MDDPPIAGDVAVPPRGWAGLAVLGAAAFVLSLDTMVLYVGIAAVTIAVVLLALGIVRSDEWGWRDLRTVAALAGGLALVGAFVARCATVPTPVLALELFSERGFRWANLAQLLYGTGFTIMFFGNVQFLSEVWGYSPVRVGLAMAPGPFVVFLVAPRFGKLRADRAARDPDPGKAWSTRPRR